MTELVTEVREAVPWEPATAVTTGEKTETAAEGEPVTLDPEEPEEVAELNSPRGTAEAGTTTPAGEDEFSEEEVVTAGVFTGDKAASMPRVRTREPEDSGMSAGRCLGGPREEGR